MIKWTTARGLKEDLMKTVLKLEEVAALGLAFYLFLGLEYAWW